MLSLVAGTASFANPVVDQKAVSQTRVVMTADHKIKLYAQPIQSKGEVKIVDAAGQSLYTSVVSLQKGLYQNIDFSNLGTGTYQISLKVGDQTVVKTFVIQSNPNESFVMQ